MISPRFSNGANTALRVPIASFAPPVFIRFHSSYRSPTARLLCSIATSLPKYSEKVCIICGVSAISGTRSMAHFPLLIVSSISRIYTEVFPLPVTPHKSAASGQGSSSSFFMPVYASFCSRLSSGRGFSFPVHTSGRRKTSSLSATTNCAFISAFSDCRDAPVKCMASLADTRPVEHISSSSAACMGAFRRMFCAVSKASSASIARLIISRILSFTWRAPSALNQQPAGRMVLTASYTVQNSLSCIHRASLS